MEVTKDQNPGYQDNISCTSVESLPKTHKGVYFFGVLAALGGASVGYDTGVISGIMGAMPLFNDRFLGDATESPYRSGLLVAMMLLTATLGGLLSGNLCGKGDDKKGAWNV